MTAWVTTLTWTAESDGEISRSVVTFPEQTELFPKYVRVTSGNRKPILRSQKRRGASGKILRFATDLNVEVVDSVDLSGKKRFRAYCLFHSPNGILGILALLCLAIGPVLRGSSPFPGWQIRTGS